MAWRNLKVLFITTTLLYLWICSQVSCEVDVNCWWNKALAVGHNVSVLCHMSTRGRANSCGLCQLYVIILDHRHEFPGTCASSKETFNFSISAEHRESVQCLCNRNISDTCSVTVRDWPSPPSRPDCAIEDEIEDIYCSWTKPNEEMIPTVYTLHWKDYDGNVKSRESSSESAVIYRLEYMTSAEITVWVTAKNELGSAESERSVFNTGHIKRPDAPYNINLTSEPLELIWDMDCDMDCDMDKICQVQYRAHNPNMDWTEVDDCQVMFMLENPQPYTHYSFRVRCHCGYEEKVMSKWSSVYSIRTPPAAPVGQLDVWSDCGPNSDKSSCNVYWKEMPLSQARGEIINYIVTIKLKNGTEVKQQVSRQRRDTGSQQLTPLSCRQLRHYLRSDVMGVFVSANTSIGTSDPTYVLFAERGQRAPAVNLSIIGDSHALRVSWTAHTEFESILEYVVQHVSVVPDILCLNWVRVKRNQRSVTLTGDFWNYTAYNVSLFAVSNNHSTFLKSAIAYTLEGVPPKVPQIHVENITHSSATLIWSPIPVNESKGVILHYLVGIKETGSNLSSNRTSMQLSELQPAQQYHIWVSAVSTAGEGDKLLTTFSTSEKISNATLLTVFIILMPLILFVLVFVLVYKPDRFFVKIPDPINSKTFKHMNFQHAWPRLYSPSELNIKISELEIMEKPDCDTPTPPSETEQNKAFIDVEPQHFQLPNGLDRTNKGGDEPDEEPEESSRRNILKHDNWAKEYSEMVDTDEEKDGGDEEEWWDQQCVSDYERHFLPSVAAN